MAVLGSPLILVSTNLNKVLAFLESVTSNTVSTFAINASTSPFSPFNGATYFKALPTDMNSVIFAVLLSGLTTCVSA